VSRGRYPSDRRNGLMQIAAAVVGSAAAAKVVHRETQNMHDMPKVVVDPRWIARPFVEADHSYHLHPFGLRCRCICDPDGQTERSCPEHGERAYRYTPRDRVIDAAREYARTGGEAHHELMDAVAALEQAERETAEAVDSGEEWWRNPR
jgi:hypothetical protein